MEEPEPAGRLSEKDWVASLGAGLADASLRVKPAFRLPYRHEVYEYIEGGIEPAKRDTAGYVTDLLIYERVRRRGSWVPRVIIEFKLGKVTTHDALTYSAKAATHKHVHPYLRYGILIGRVKKVPARLVRHGAQFDFMAVWQSERPTPGKCRALAEVLRSEVSASRELQSLLTKPTLHSHRIMHRPLTFPSVEG